MANDSSVSKSGGSVVEVDYKAEKTEVLGGRRGLSERELYNLRQSFPLIADASQEKLNELNKSVLRKLDWKFLPVVTLMLLMNYLDRINVSNARLAGMQEDLHMTDVEWSAGISLFHVGYMIPQIPASILIAKGKPRVVLPFVMLTWSVVTLCMPAVRSAWAFMLCRFIIGVVEGPFFPSVALMSSSWYMKQETPSRMAIWHAGNTLSNAFSGLIAAGVLENMEGVAKLRAWQWFFLIEGIASVLVALIGFWGLPNFPNNTGSSYFTEEETQMAQYRQIISAGGISEDEEGGFWKGFWQALKEPFSWMFAALHFAVIIAQSFKEFFPSIVNTLGFNSTVTYLIQAPPYFVAYILTLGVSWSSGRYLEHCYHMIGPIAGCLIGAVVMISTLNVGARYFAMFLLCSGPFIAQSILFPWATAVVPRPRTKLAGLIAIANCLSMVSDWFSPYFFLRSQEPRYQTGGGVIIAGSGLTIITCLVIRWWCQRKNKQLEKEEQDTGIVNSWRFST